LFPGVRTPLHIFEQRYRQMTRSALAGDRRIAMAVIRPDFLGDVAGDPPVFEIACAGTIIESEQLGDGRFHILLRGDERVRLLGEEPPGAGQLYRSARVQRLVEECPADASERIAAMRSRLAELVGDLLGTPGDAHLLGSAKGLDDRAFVNSLCAALPLATPEKQGLLEMNDIPGRCHHLIEILEFMQAEGRRRRVPNSSALH